MHNQVFLGDEASLTTVSLPGEEWRTAGPGTELFVSNLGRVYSTHNGCGGEHPQHVGGIQQQWASPHGFYCVKDYAFRTRVVHDLVYGAFVCPDQSPRHWRLVHRDGDQANNRLENLRDENA